MPSCISITHLYSYFYARNRLVMTFDGLVMQDILPLENKSAIVKSTRKLSMNLSALSNIREVMRCLGYH